MVYFSGGKPLTTKFTILACRFAVHYKCLLEPNLISYKLIPASGGLLFDWPKSQQKDLRPIQTRPATELQNQFYF